MKWFETRMVVVSVLGLCLLLAADVPTARADFVFGQPVPIVAGGNPSLSADGLELYFGGREPTGQFYLLVARRATVDCEWGIPLRFGPPVNTGQGQHSPSISADGLSLYFATATPWAADARLYVTKRATKDDDWGAPVSVGAAVNTHHAVAPCISADDLELYFASNRPGGYGVMDLWVTTRATVNDAWGTPVNLGPSVNTSGFESCWPGISPDGLLLFFDSNRPGGFAVRDLYVARRATREDAWGPPMNLGPIANSNSNDYGPKVSFDGSMLYFYSYRPGGPDMVNIWQAPILPIVDFNGDGKVDKADMHIMVDHWGENYSLCDIGPTPLGDGIVDIHDMAVLAEHLYRLAAHWKLDETDGSIAYDSRGGYDGTLNGNQFWQPTSGMKGGCLMLDGIDDYVETPFILDPSKGSFSVFAWIYSWTPGQVIISQTGNFGSTWLGTDPTGKLMTGLGDIYFGALVSETVITDIQWHHVGLVYDMDTLHRRLYVDGVLITEDTTVVYGAPSNNGMYIGASKDLETGTFFSGLIDDVRIYKQALTTEEIAALAR